jgi:N-glycosylase/DNA lyase
MSVKELEAKLNRRLKEIHRGYAVKNLKRLPSGEYWFDLAMAFNARDMAKVNRVFAEVLSQGRGKRRQTVQAKFYLSAETYERLRKEAADRGVKQSTLVEEALQSVLA